MFACNVVQTFFRNPALCPTFAFTAPAGQRFIVSFNSESVSTDDQQHAQLLRADLIFLLGVTPAGRRQLDVFQRGVKRISATAVYGLPFYRRRLRWPFPAAVLAALTGHEWRASALVGLFFRCRHELLDHGVI